ncbi:MAG: SIR2 family protein [Methylococcaceae bacterium]
MSKQWILNSEKVIESVEGTLQKAYEENKDIHVNLDGESPVEIKSLKDDREPYMVERSEILFWVDRKAYYEEMEFCLLKHHEDAIEFIKQNELKPVFKDFVDAIKKQRIVPFVGAGLSNPSGYPLWGDALKDISKKIDGLNHDEIAQKLKAYEYFDVAQILWKKESAQVKSYIRNKFSEKHITEDGPVGAINYISNISNGCVVTTNFDGLIESVIGKGNFQGYMHGRQQGNKFVSKLIKGERCIMKLHGDADDFDTYVFTKEQYDEAYGDPLDFTRPLPKALRQVYVTSSMVFLGCALENDMTLELFKLVMNYGEFDVPDHFAILPIPESGETKNQKDARLNNLKIRAIWYPSRDHSFVEKYIKLALDIATDRLRDF